MKTWNNNGVEAIKDDGKKWINEKRLQTALGFKKLASNKIVKISNPVENLLQKY